MNELITTVETLKTKEKERKESEEILQAYLEIEKLKQEKTDRDFKIAQSIRANAELKKQIKELQSETKKSMENLASVYVFVDVMG